MMREESHTCLCSLIGEKAEQMGGCACACVRAHTRTHMRARVCVCPIVPWNLLLNLKGNRRRLCWPFGFGKRERQRGGDNEEDAETDGGRNLKRNVPD